MRLFIETKASADPGFVALEASRLRMTPSYAEWEFRIDEALFAFVYYLPRDASSASIVACFGSMFDGLATSIATADPPVRYGLVRAVHRTFPALARALQNAADERMNEGALVQANDPDDATRKWFMMSVLGNIDPFDGDTVTSARCESVVQLVYAVSAGLFAEWSEHEIDKVAMSMDIMKASLKRDATMAAKIGIDNLGLISQLFKS